MLLLDAATTATPLPPGSPWWAAVALTLAIALINTIGLVLVARAGRKPAPKDDPLKPVKATLGEHGSTLADHTSQLKEHAATLGAHDEALTDEQRIVSRVGALEATIQEMKRESQERDKARHEADSRMERSLGFIEGALNVGGRGNDRR